MGVRKRELGIGNQLLISMHLFLRSRRDGHVRARLPPGAPERRVHEAHWARKGQNRNQLQVPTCGSRFYFLKFNFILFYTESYLHTIKENYILHALIVEHLFLFLFLFSLLFFYFYFLQFFP